MSIRHRIFCLLAWLLSANVFATTDKERPSRHLPKPTADYLRLTAYIDGSYNYLTRNNQFTSGVNDRVYDLAENGFSLQQAAATLSYQPSDGLGGLLNVVVGRDALNLAPNGLNPDLFGSSEFGATIPQAYLQYALGEMTLNAGEMLALAGLETYNYTLDDNFSRSILYGYAQPGIHMGVRTVAAPNQYWKVIIGMNNGWSTVRNAGNLNHLELGLGFAIDEYFNAMLSLQSGSEYLTSLAYSGPTGTSNLVDLYATWHVTQKLSLSMNGDYGVQSKALRSNGSVGQVVWQGMALYLNYVFNADWRSSIRGEIFEDGDGYQTGIRQNWRELTLTLGYLPIKQLEVRAELRHDISNKNAFKNKNGNGASHNQQSFALEALYQFEKEVV